MTRLTAHLPPARLRDLLRAGGLDDLPDADLLDRFARYGEHPAFDALLRRHGPMVLGVCRRVLANPADADDAFQATFLVLVRKARSVRGARLGPWLYGVAFRVALKARSRRARLAVRTTEATDMIPDPRESPEVPDWLPILDAELNALPAKYREPLVLCELQGASRADGAKALGIPEGTLSSRLARGRELLRKRLLKHGTLLPAGGLAALLAAGGVGRAAVPAGLFAKTSEVVAVVATGAAPAGAVPAGPARLTDEVLKGMLLTKLRMAGGAILAAGLVAFGALAAWPADAPGQQTRPKPKPAGSEAKAAPAAGPRGGGQELRVDAGPLIADRDALQGLWVLDKVELGKGIGENEQREMKEMIGRMRFLVAGDVWWGMVNGPGGNIFPQVAKLDPAKNPKWLDLQEAAPGSPTRNRCIYELNGDRLRICVTPTAGGDPRPAEFTTDDDTPLQVLEFRREKLPPVTGDPGIFGSWVGMPEVTTPPDGQEYTYTPRVEILGGHLFAFVADPKSPHGSWVGGAYTVDTSKNPKWIDVDLVQPMGEKVTRLHGSFDIIDGRLKMVLGTTGKRVLRPLELTTGPDTIFLNVKPAATPLAAPEKVVRETAPAPRPNPEAEENEEVRKLMTAGDYAAAEKFLREHLPKWTGWRKTAGQLRLGCCVLHRAKGPNFGETVRCLADAEALFRQVVADTKDAPAADKPVVWLRTQAELRLLQVFQQAQRPNDLLAAASPFLEKHRGTVEELVALSFVWHAHKLKREDDKAFEARDRMKVLFDHLKDKPGAFTAETGEYSRGYWEKTWFAEG